MDTEYRYLNRGLFLLSIDQVARLPKVFRCIKASDGFDGYIDKQNGTVAWWTRTPLKNKSDDTGVHIVLPDGEICRCVSNPIEYAQYNFCNKGTCCYAEWVAVVPAMYISLEELVNMKRDEKGHILYGFKSSGSYYKWIDISSYMDKPVLLMAECLPIAMRFDEKSNDYETSDIKRFLEKMTIIE